MVTQTGLVLESEGVEHPAYRALRERREICTLSLAGRAGIDRVRSLSGRVYVAENEIVLTQMCDLAASFRSLLWGCMGTGADVVQTISAVLHALNAGTGERASQSDIPMLEKLIILF